MSAGRRCTPQRIQFNAVSLGVIEILHVDGGQSAGR
jgi:hypothetical protein